MNATTAEAERLKAERLGAETEAATTAEAERLKAKRLEEEKLAAQKQAEAERLGAETTALAEELKAIVAKGEALAEKSEEAGKTAIAANFKALTEESRVIVEDAKKIVAVEGLNDTPTQLSTAASSTQDNTTPKKTDAISDNATTDTQQVVVKDATTTAQLNNKNMSQTQKAAKTQKTADATITQGDELDYLLEEETDAYESGDEYKVDDAQQNSNTQTFVAQCNNLSNANNRKGEESNKFISKLLEMVTKKLTEEATKKAHDILRAKLKPGQTLTQSMGESFIEDTLTTVDHMFGNTDESETDHDNGDGAWNHDAYDLVNEASDADRPNKKETERLLRKFGDALDKANGTEGKFSGAINKAMNTHLLSKTVGASAVLPFLAPILAASGPGEFDLKSFQEIFTQDNSGEMLTALVIIVMLAIILRILEDSLKKDDKEAATDLKSEIKAQLTKIATGEAIDNESIAALKGKFQKLNALCSNGAGMTGTFEPLINNLIETGIKNNIILNDKKGLAKFEDKASGIMKRGVQAVRKGEVDIKKTRNSIIQIKNADAKRKASAISGIKTTNHQQTQT